MRAEKQRIAGNTFDNNKNPVPLPKCWRNISNFVSVEHKLIVLKDYIYFTVYKTIKSNVSIICVPMIYRVVILVSIYPSSDLVMKQYTVLN